MTDITEIIATLKPDLAIATNSKSPYSERYAAMDRATDILSLEVVCELIEALEAKEDQRANWFHVAQQQGNDLVVAEARIAELNKRNSALTAKIEPMDRRAGELTMWVKRLAHSLRKANPDSKLQSDAMDYLSRTGLISVEDVLR